jgi:hypothetical protein
MTQAMVVTAQSASEQILFMTIFFASLSHKKTFYKKEPRHYATVLFTFFLMLI